VPELHVLNFKWRQKFVLTVLLIGENGKRAREEAESEHSMLHRRHKVLEKLVLKFCNLKPKCASIVSWNGLSGPTHAILAHVPEISSSLSTLLELESNVLNLHRRKKNASTV